MLRDSQDAHGHIMCDCLKGVEAFEIVERDDGYFDANDGRVYLSTYDQWSPVQKQAIEHARGKVLDIGCGAGRHAIYLQNKGLEVVGIDISPLAVETCGLRGLSDVRVMSISEVTSGLGVFDTILMMGNNFGLFGSRAGAKKLLKRLLGVTSADAVIIAESMDPHETQRQEHLTYHRRNVNRGRMPGQVRIRVRYRKYVTPWFDYLFVSEGEMTDILDDTGWRIKEVIAGQGPAYVAVIEKGKRPVLDKVSSEEVVRSIREDREQR